MSIVMSAMPLPPSSNMAYRNVPKVGRVKTAELREYERAMANWSYENIAAVVKAVHEIRKWRFVAVRFVFVFKKERIITKDGRPKKLDTSNRIKCAEDALAKALGIDDRSFWVVSAEKQVAPNGHEEFAFVILDETTPRHLASADGMRSETMMFAANTR